MFCSKCGRALPNDAKFCGGCGNPVKIAPEPVAEEIAPEPVAEEIAPVAVAEEIAPVAVTEEIAPEPVAEEIAPEPVAEEIAPEPVAEEIAPVAVTEEIAPEPVAEEIAPEPVAEEIAPVAVTEEIAPEPVAEEIAPEPLPESFSEAVRENAPKKKKSKVGAVIACSAVALVGAVAAVGYFCFSNQIMRLIKGDKGYAMEIAAKSYTDYVFDGEEIDFDAFDSSIALALENKRLEESDDYSDDSDLAAILKSNSMKTLLDMYGDSELKISTDIKLKSLLSLSLGSDDSVSALLDFINSIEYVRTAQSGDDCDKYAYSITFDGEALIGAEQFTSDSLSVLTMPEITDEVFYIALEDDEKFPTEEVKRIREEIRVILEKYYDEAEFIYTDGEFNVAGNTVKGTEIKTVFSRELSNTIYEEIKTLIENDETLSGWFDDEDEDNGEDEKLEAEFTFCTYIAPHSEIIGKKIIVNDLSDEPKSVAVGFIRNDDETRFVLDSEDGGQFSAISALETVTDSFNTTSDVINTEITYLEDKDSLPLVLNLRCEDPQKIHYHGQTLNGGSYTLSLSDKDMLFSSYFLGNDEESDEPDSDMMEDFGSSAMMISALKGLKIKWSLTGDENKLNADFSFYSSSLAEITFTAELIPYDASETAVMPDISDGIDLSDEVDEKVKNQLTTSISKGLLEKIQTNEKLLNIAEKLNLTESIEEEIAEMEKAEIMLENYSGYTSSSEYNAIRAAEHIYDSFVKEFWNGALNLDEEETEKYSVLSGGRIYTDVFTIKLYYDENGVQVIDDAGFGFIDFDALVDDSEEYRNLYCELTLDFMRATESNKSLYYDYESVQVLTGVCAVYTDDPGNIPSSLPNTYNYIDGVFEWGGEANYKDNFVIGTYPTLKEGVSTYFDEQENFNSRKETLDGYALTVGKAVTAYLRSNPDLLDDITDESFFVVFNSSDWSVKTAVNGENKSSYIIANTFRKSDISDYLAEKLKNKDLGGAEIQLHFINRDSLLTIYEDYWDETPDLPENQQAVFIGTAAVEADSGINYLNENVPHFYDYVFGYSVSWAYNGYYSYLPMEGKFYIDEDNYIPFGSWCSSINGPFRSIYDS